jgi:hypothetical protein
LCAVFTYYNIALTRIAQEMYLYSLLFVKLKVKSICKMFHGAIFAFLTIAAFGPWAAAFKFVPGVYLRTVLHNPTTAVGAIVDPAWAPLAPVTERLARTLDVIEKDFLPSGFPRGLLPSHLLSPGMVEMPMVRRHWQIIPELV